MADKSTEVPTKEKTIDSVCQEVNELKEQIQTWEKVFEEFPDTEKLQTEINQLKADSKTQDKALNKALEKIKTLEKEVKRHEKVLNKQSPDTSTPKVKKTPLKLPTETEFTANYKENGETKEGKFTLIAVHPFLNPLDFRSKVHPAEAMEDPKVLQALVDAGRSIVKLVDN